MNLVSPRPGKSPVPYVRQFSRIRTSENFQLPGSLPGFSAPGLSRVRLVKQTFTRIDKMLIKIGYEIALRYPSPTTVIHLLNVHPSRRSNLVEPERLATDPILPVEDYYDRFGNHRSRLHVPAGRVRFFSESVIRDSGQLDTYARDAMQMEVRELPASVLGFLLPSRYCEVDSELMHFAWRIFRHTVAGWQRVQAICDFVHGHIQFDYQQARGDRTALGAFRERVGVCRDFAHLAITLCRCMNIRARYATGYLEDIGDLRYLIPWISVPGLRFTCRVGGTPSMLGTTVVESGVC